MGIVAINNLPLLGSALEDALKSFAKDVPKNSFSTIKPLNAFKQQRGLKKCGRLSSRPEGSNGQRLR